MRQDYGKEKYETLEFQRKVASSFSKVFLKLNQKIEMITVNDHSIQEISLEIRKITNDRLSQELINISFF